MTCKHPKSSRAYEIYEQASSLNIREDKHIDFPRGCIIPVENINDIVQINEKYIRTICADCGKVLKEVKVIET